MGTTDLERAQALAERPTEASRKSKHERAGEVAKLRFSLLRASVMGGDLRCEGSEEVDRGGKEGPWRERGS